MTHARRFTSYLGAMRFAHEVGAKVFAIEHVSFYEFMLTYDL